jgi:NitT/TauT family transport system substrate-binding protein
MKLNKYNDVTVNERYDNGGNRMKKLNLIITLLISVLALTACAAKSGQTTEENTLQGITATAAPTKIPAQETTPSPASQPITKTDINIAALKGPTAIGMVKVMEDTTTGATANNYNFTIAGTADEISIGLVKGDFDVAAVPCNLAAVLYNKTQGKIKLAGINTLGVLYIVETGDNIKKVEDLKGKTIYSTGLGTTPQYTLNYLLSAYGIDPEKDVTIEYKTEATEVAAMLSEADDAVAMLPQPYVTTVMMNNDKVKVALDVAKEWEAVSEDGSSVVTGVVVARSEFIDNNKEAFDAFLTEYSASAEYVNTNIDEASVLVEKFDIFKAAVIKKALPYCNITLLRGEDMKTKVTGYLTALYNQNPQAVGGTLPADDFYYMP